MRKDYYYILGVKKDATDIEVKEAYRKLVHKFHPDKNNGDKFFEDRFKEIQEAYDILSNKNRRILYDSSLNNKSTSTQNQNVNSKNQNTNKSNTNSSKNISKVPFYIRHKGAIITTLVLIAFFSYLVEGQDGLITILKMYASLPLGIWSIKEAFAPSTNGRGSFGCLIIGIGLIIFSLLTAVGVLSYIYNAAINPINKKNEKIEHSIKDNSDVSASFQETAADLFDSAVTDTNTDNTSSIESTQEYIKESEFKGNQLANGASPFNTCFGNGQYEGNAYIIFDNGNSTDVVVCLTEYRTGRTIRNEYIRAGQKYKVKNIPSGIYAIKGYYGNDWNPNKQNFCGTKGGFDNSEYFSKSDDIGDLINIENSSRSFTSGTITLYSVENGNMGTKSINENEFFK